jgi:hypothetical protein
MNAKVRAKTRRRCACGRTMNRYATKCKLCSEAQRKESIAKAKAIVARGVCPICNAPLRRNNSLAGWWQCGQFGAWERDAPTKQSCSFQCFTE